MGVILTRSPRTQQPQGAVQASSWARSRGIGSLLLPSAGWRDLVDGGTWTTWGTAPTRGTGRHGICIDSTAAFGGLMLMPRVNQATAAQTHILLVETTAVSGAYAGLLACALGDGSGNSLSVQREGTNVQWATWPDGATPSWWASPTSQAFGPALLIIAGDSSGTATYLDGALINSAATAITTQANSRLVLGGERSASAGYATKARIYLYAHLTQRLTAGEVAALSANPWQLFAPITRCIWVPSAGGSNATATLTGASTTSTAGTLSATGGAAKTLTGASTTASAGTVSASTSTNATATLTGASTTASAGTLSATGAASVTLTGAGATASAGTVSATAGGNAAVTLPSTATTSTAGTLSATGGAAKTLTGASTTANAGTVLASAGTNASVTLTGASTSASVGALSASGAAQIVLTGVQVTASAGTVTATGVRNASVTLTGTAATAYAGAVSAYAGILNVFTRPPKSATLHGKSRQVAVLLSRPDRDIGNILKD